MTQPVLFDYWRSSASYRVRIALNLKGIGYRAVPVDLVSGAQRAPEHQARNPQGLVPVLEIDGRRLVQSLAMIEYLDATRPDPPLVPTDPGDAAHVRSLALAVACDIHPVNNLRILKYLGGRLGADEDARSAWYSHWVSEGLAALEALASEHAGRFLFGDAPTLADLCLIPQMYNARRFNVPTAGFPLLVRVDEEANRIEAFAAAHPDRVAPAPAAG